MYLLIAYSTTAPASSSSFQQHDRHDAEPVNFLAVTPTSASLDGVITVAWTVSATSITFTLTSTLPSGWVAVGINNDGPSMSGADIYVGWYDSTSGHVVVADSYGIGHIMPSPDTNDGGTNDATSVSGTKVRN